MKLSNPRTRAASMLTFCALLLAPSVAFAAGGDMGHVIHIAIFHAINLALLLGLVIFAGRKAFSRFLKSRKERITNELKEAQQLHEEARAMLESYQARIDGFETERETLMTEYRDLAEAERDRILREAKEQAEKIRNDAELTVQQEIQNAKASLESEVLTLATKMAEDLMAKELDDSKHDALINDYIVQIEQQATLH